MPTELNSLRSRPSHAGSRSAARQRRTAPPRAGDRTRCRRTGTWARSPPDLARPIGTRRIRVPMVRHRPPVRPAEVWGTTPARVSRPSVGVTTARTGRSCGSAGNSESSSPSYSGTTVRTVAGTRARARSYDPPPRPRRIPRRSTASAGTTTRSAVAARGCLIACGPSQAAQSRSRSFAQHRQQQIRPGGQHLGEHRRQLRPARLATDRGVRGYPTRPQPVDQGRQFGPQAGCGGSALSFGAGARARATRSGWPASRHAPLPLLPQIPARNTPHATLAYPLLCVSIAGNGRATSGGKGKR